MRWPWLTLTLIAGYLWWCWRTLFANRGLVPFMPWVDVFEPQQRALIAWDGYEEILILSTDLYTSETTQVLEIMPLPSEPSVTAKGIDLFHRLNELINSLVGWDFSAKGTVRGVSFDQLGPAGEVTFHQQIGAHDISVTHLLRRDGFVSWAEDYLRTAGVSSPHIPADLAAIVQEYIDEGFNWFVFDVISTLPMLRTNEPIQYRFKSIKLYYPLRITRTARGTTEIELYVLSRWHPNFMAHGIARDRISYRLRRDVQREAPLDAQTAAFLRRLNLIDPRDIDQSEGWVVSPEQLQFLDDELAAFFKGHPKVLLQPWRIEGDLEAFDRDLLAY